MLLFEDGEKLIFAGDSVCAAGRDAGRPLGDGYVKLVDSLLRACYPGRRILVENLGTAPQTTAEFLEWGVDPIRSCGADHAALLIGSDEARVFFQSPERLPIQQYGENMREIVEKLIPDVKSLILMTPFFAEPNPEDPLRELMEDYRRELSDIASEYMLTLVDLQKEFDRYLLCRHPLSVAPDRLTPNDTGSALIARAFLRETGFSFAGEPDLGASAL